MAKVGVAGVQLATRVGPVAVVWQLMLVELVQLPAGTGVQSSVRAEHERSCVVLCWTWLVLVLVCVVVCVVRDVLVSVCVVPRIIWLVLCSICDVLRRF